MGYRISFYGLVTFLSLYWLSTLWPGQPLVSTDAVRTNTVGSSVGWGSQEFAAEKVELNSSQHDDLENVRSHFRILVSTSTSTSQELLDKAAGCRLCLSELAAIVDDASLDETHRLAAGEILAKSGRREGVLTLTQAAVTEGQMGQDDFKDSLLQLFPAAVSMEAARTFISILSGWEPGLDFVHVPEDIQIAIQEAVRSNPHFEAVGNLLMEEYTSQTSEEARTNILTVRHPFLLALLARDAYGRGDIDGAQQFTRLLADTDGDHAVRGIMLLAGESIVPDEEIASLSHSWSRSYGSTDADRLYVDYLTGFESSHRQRSAAALGLAGSMDSRRSLLALEKAMDHERDPLVLGSLEIALDSLRRQDARPEDSDTPPTGVSTLGSPELAE
jgi:hypothetical protein